MLKQSVVTPCVCKQVTLKIKSKIEIQYISKVCSIASKVFDNFPEQIYPKISEREATSIFKKELINNGVDYIMYMACASGQGGYDQSPQPDFEPSASQQQAPKQSEAQPAPSGGMGFDDDIPF